jgi:adenylate kinase
MRLVLLGPPGGGKGTQGVRLSRHFGVRHVAAGDVLRAEVAARTAVGRRVEGLLARGELVPDELVTEALRAVLIAAANDGGYVLDGYPRTLRQAEILGELRSSGTLIGPHTVVYLDVPAAELERRLLRRAREQGRRDDTPAVIARRLTVFDEATRPLTTFYERRGLLARVDGSRDADAITSTLIVLLEPVRPS